MKNNMTFFSCLTGLPIQVRDTGLAIKEDIPRSDVNKEYYTQNMEREVFFFIFALSEKPVLGFFAHSLSYSIIFKQFIHNISVLWFGTGTGLLIPK